MKYILKIKAMKRLNETQQINLRIVIVLAFIAAMVLFFNSCSVQQVPYRDLTPPNEDLLEYNENDFKVLSFDFPYAKVYLPDSTIDFVYCPYCEITGTGYLISER